MSNQEKLEAAEVVYLLREVLEVYNDPEISPDLADAYALAIEDNFGIDVTAFFALDTESEGAGYAIGEFVASPFDTMFPNFAATGCTREHVAQRIADSLIANAARKAKGGN